MKNIYNKAKFRGYEYAKHLRPFLKRKGNKMWRKGASATIDDQIVANNYDSQVCLSCKTIKKKVKKTIKLKITFLGCADKKYSRYVSYRTIKDAQNAINRNRVVGVIFINKDN
jgi:hypothetical protein